MNIHFETVDPRGRRVICTREIWFDKILVKRPWREGWGEVVRAAIESPSMPICKAADYEDRQVYYRRLNKNSPRYIKVIVDFENKESGVLISAYPADSGKSVEMPI